jgi:hypothetical protein
LLTSYATFLNYVALSNAKQQYRTEQYGSGKSTKKFNTVMATNGDPEVLRGILLKDFLTRGGTREVNLDDTLLTRLRDVVEHPEKHLDDANSTFDIAQDEVESMLREPFIRFREQSATQVSCQQ